MVNIKGDGKVVKRLVIIGGGFGGVNLALRLKSDPDYHITLVDKNNYNFFPPLIYQVATGFLENSNISYPFRKLFRKYPNIHFRLGELIKVDPAAHTIQLNNGEISYDYLVFSTGATSNFFGLENIRKNAIPMKNVDDALNMRNTLLQRLELATITTDPSERKKLLTIVVAGGGPTGVEVSGMLADLRVHSFSKDYPELKGTGAEIFLVDGGSHLLSPMSPASQNDTFEALNKMRVIMKLNTQVKDFADDKVVLSTGEIIESKNLIWTAGVTASEFNGIPAECYGKSKRLIADPFNKVVGLTDVYAVGDTCLQTHEPAYPAGHPQLAQVSIQQAKLLGDNFKNMANGKPLKAFHYKDLGTMAIIGRNKAVCDLPHHVHFKGFIAWFLWLFIHLVSLLNYRNRLKTLFNWTIAYINKDQSLRFIVRPRSDIKI
ncbi:MAG: NAD(P)/FAD-dependent oxidoreductase [Bacteroidota bacterium]|nr:NAD(P)/FAD-dependent oxidoreductase [Bacteroidota bacterium]